VEIAKRVESSLEDGVVQASTVISDLSPAVSTTVLNARNKIAPFVDDNEATQIRELCEQIESSGGADQGLIDQLEAINQKYNYLF